MCLAATTYTLPKIYSPLANDAFAEMRELPKRSQQHATLLNAWLDTTARAALTKVIEKGVLKYDPSAAALVIEQLNKSSLLSSGDEEVVQSLRSIFADRSFSKGKEESFQIDEALRVQRRVTQIADVIKEVPSTVLDIGCGNGEILKGLSRAWNLTKENCIGVDVYRRVSENDEFTYKNVREGVLPINSNSVDVATMLMTLHHEENPEGLLKEAFRVLKPGGKLIIRDHNAESTSDHLMFCALDTLYFSLFTKNAGVPKPETYRSAKEWESVARTCGFKVEKIFNPEPESPIQPFHMVLTRN